MCKRIKSIWAKTLNFIYNMPSLLVLVYIGKFFLCAPNFFFLTMVKMEVQKAVGVNTKISSPPPPW